MRFEQSERGYVEDDEFEVKISEPRGQWSEHHLEVVAKVNSTGVSVIQAELTDDVVAMIYGSEDGVATCARVWELIKEAAEDYPELDLERVEG